mmetsp:Transcript_28887/g.51509  ORF Transcript_28887/g.51509 Transcript_28887/m.51509 type:complete len:317 (+) Transcript_28887:1252-2202(+)
MHPLGKLGTSVIKVLITEGYVLAYSANQLMVWSLTEGFPQIVNTGFKVTEVMGLDLKNHKVFITGNIGDSATLEVLNFTEAAESVAHSLGPTEYYKQTSNHTFTDDSLITSTIANRFLVWSLKSEGTNILRNTRAEHNFDMLKAYPAGARLLALGSSQVLGFHAHVYSLPTLDSLAKIPLQNWYVHHNPTFSIHFSPQIDYLRILFKGQILTTIRYTQDKGAHVLVEEPIRSDTQINAVSAAELHFAIACQDNSVHVHSYQTLEKSYVLLGGSLNPRTLPKSFVPNPLIPGCSLVRMDDEKIVGVFGNLIRVYEFE